MGYEITFNDRTSRFKNVFKLYCIFLNPSDNYQKCFTKCPYTAGLQGSLCSHFFFLDRQTEHELSGNCQIWIIHKRVKIRNMLKSILYFYFYLFCMYFVFTLKMAQFRVIQNSLRVQKSVLIDLYTLCGLFCRELLLLEHLSVLNYSTNVYLSDKIILN